MCQKQIDKTTAKQIDLSIKLIKRYFGPFIMKYSVKYHNDRIYIIFIMYNANIVLVFNNIVIEIIKKWQYNSISSLVNQFTS